MLPPSSGYKILVSIYQSTRYHNPEDRNPCSVSHLAVVTYRRSWRVLVRVLSFSVKWVSDSSLELTDRFPSSSLYMHLSTEIVSRNKPRLSAPIFSKFAIHKQSSYLNQQYKVDPSSLRMAPSNTFLTDIT